MASGRYKILVLGTFFGEMVKSQSISDYLFSFHAYSRHQYYYVFDCRTLSPDFDFDQFDAIIISWTIYLPGGILSRATMDAISRSRAHKIQFLQDEYRDVRPINRLLAQLGVQHMFTCVEPEQHDLFYPKSVIPSLQSVHTVRTGYVPEYLMLNGVRHDEDRPIDIAYRAREVPYCLGDLGREKFIVAGRFNEIAAKYDFKADISAREVDRIYGRQWVKFVGSSRFALGTSSGASVIDFTGDIKKNCDAYMQQYPDASYEQVREKFFADVDGKVVIDTISPRIFEAAALGTVMVFHEGNYSGILKPDRHYIPVKKDYSNVEEVVAKMRDTDFCRTLRQQAYDDLIASGEYSYKAFVQQFDQTLAEILPPPRATTRQSPLRFHWHRYRRFGQDVFPRGHGYVQLPRISRWAASVLRTVLPPRLRLSLPALPENLLIKTFGGIGYSLRAGSLRTLLMKGVPVESDTDMSFYSRLRDAYRLRVLRAAQRGKLITPTPFRVRILYDPAARRLRLVSVACDESVTRAADNGNVAMVSVLQIRSLAKSGGIDSVVWDHSNVDQSLHLQLTHFRRATIDLGPRGQVELPWLARVLISDVDAGIRLLIPIIGPAEKQAGREASKSIAD